MTPQEQQQFDDLKQQVVTLQEQVKALNNNATIPFEIGEAFKARILQDAGVLATSSKAANSESVAVLTSTGPNVYTDVLAEPNSWVQMTISGNVIYLPSFT